MLKTQSAILPKIGTPVIAKVSLLRSPEGSVGRVVRFLFEHDGLVVIIESAKGQEIPVRFPHYPYFFQELSDGTSDVTQLHPQRGE